MFSSKIELLSLTMRQIASASPVHDSVKVPLRDALPSAQTRSVARTLCHIREGMSELSGEYDDTNCFGVPVEHILRALFRLFLEIELVKVAGPIRKIGACRSI